MFKGKTLHKRKSQTRQKRKKKKATERGQQQLHSQLGQMLRSRQTQFMCFGVCCCVFKTPGTYLVVTFDFGNVERLGGPVARYLNLLLLVEPDELSRGRLDEILKHFQVRQTFLARHRQLRVRLLQNRHVMDVNGRLLALEFVLLSHNGTKEKENNK
jgi:hypothetical protein